MKFVQIERRSEVSRADLHELFVHLNEIVWENMRSDSIPISKLSGRISRNFITPPDAPVPDCLTCGICCVTTFDVQLAHYDATEPENYWNIPLDDSANEITVNRVLRRDSQTGRCLALVGEIGENIKCEIYEQRPEACRLFDAGSDKCHALRRAANIEPPLAPHESFAALLKILDRDEPENSEQLRIFNCEIARKDTAGKLTIKVWTEDDNEQIIHEFDAENGRWLEGDFVGLTLTEARELLASLPDNSDKSANPAADSFISD